MSPDLPGRLVLYHKKLTIQAKVEEDLLPRNLGRAVEYTWSMQSWFVQILLPLSILGIMTGACSAQESNNPLPQIVESAQAAVAEQIDQVDGSPDQEQAVKELSIEEIELTLQAGDGSDQQPVACDDQNGLIVRTSYSGFLSGEAIPVLIFLPPCYDPFLRVYPVIFLLHGKPQDERHWLLLDVQSAVAQGINNGDWPPTVLVMPYQPEPLFSQTSGGPGSLEQEILSGLIPFILDRYAVSGESQRWAIGGISRGGVWALEIGLRHPEYFGSVGVLSPALNVNYAGQSYDPFQIVHRAAQLPDKIFLGAGDRDSARAMTLEFADSLEEEGVEHRYIEVEGSHESATWIQMIPQMFSYLASDW